MRTILGLAVLAALTGAAGIHPHQQPDRQPGKLPDLDRRDLRQPEVVLETGGRMGVCDVVQFTPDGEYLLAAGDDKVVRAWRVVGGNLVPAGVLRWNIWREQRGAIYALDVHQYEKAGKKGYLVAIAGWGARLNAHDVAVYDLLTGAEKYRIKDLRPQDKETPTTFTTIRALAFAPSGKRLAYGTSDGRVWLWDFGRPYREVGLMADPVDLKEKRRPNRLRLLRFEDDNRLVAVSESGHVVRWRLREDGPAHRQDLFMFGFRLGSAAMNPAGSRLAATANEGRPQVELRSLDGKRLLHVDLAAGETRCHLAFSPKGRELAVSVGGNPRAGQPEGDDRILLYDLTTVRPRARTLKHTYHADYMAYDPTGRYLAVAGGEDHEVTLRRRDDLAGEPNVARGAGGALWGVALSKDGWQLGLKTRRVPGPTHVNECGAGPWRVFDLKKRRWAPAKTRFAPLARLDEADGWRVKHHPEGSHWWWVERAGKRSPEPYLRFDPDREGMPRCYAFIKGTPTTPTRLVVGHYYGPISVYELTDDGPKRVRVCVGHHGEVTGIAVAADGRWMVSASRDQTVAAWSLAPFPDHPGELGARFTADKGVLRVAADGVALYSPAWEAGMLPGDQVDFVAVGNRLVHGEDRDETGTLTARQCLDRHLRAPVPTRELVFGVSRGKQQVRLLTTVRQRPLWRFFPTRAPRPDWVLWMWHQPYYDCSANGDSLLCWQLNQAPGRPLELIQAERFRGVLRNDVVIDSILKDRDIGKALRLAVRPEDEKRVNLRQPVNFRLFEPLAVDIRGLPAGPVEDKDVAVRLVGEPRFDNPDNLPVRAELWVNDHRLEKWDLARGTRTFDRWVGIPAGVLRSGENTLTLQVYNDVLGRGLVRAEESKSLRRAPHRAPPKLHALLVGISDYSRSPAYKKVPPLKGAANDAAALEATLRKSSAPFALGHITRLTSERATRANVVAQLEALAKANAVAPDDLFVLLLCGHGEDLQKGPVRGFVFCCNNFDRDKARDTAVTIRELYEKLAAISCRKLVLLDACRAGAAGTGSIRDLAPGGKGPTILAACDLNQQSFEAAGLGGKPDGHGYFTYAVLEALGSKFAEADTHHPLGVLDERELFAYVRRRLETLHNQGEGAQVPVCFPEEIERRGLPLFGKPPPPAARTK